MWPKEIQKIRARLLPIALTPSQICLSLSILYASSAGGRATGNTPKRTRRPCLAPLLAHSRHSQPPPRARPILSALCVCACVVRGVRGWSKVIGTNTRRNQVTAKMGGRLCALRSSVECRRVSVGCLQQTLSWCDGETPSLRDEKGREGRRNASDFGGASTCLLASKNCLCDIHSLVLPNKQTTASPSALAK